MAGSPHNAAAKTEPYTTTPGTTHPPATGSTPPLGQNDRAANPANHALTLRSITLGLVLVAIMAAVTPYNDYVLVNSPLIGNHFPIGIITLMAALVLLVNPALMFLKFRHFSTGELIVIMSLLLFGAAVPSSGLMRYMEPMLISPFELLKSGQNNWLKPFVTLMPSWLVPSTNPDSSIVRLFIEGVDRMRGETIPILPFILPAVLWSIFIGAVFGAAVYLAAILRKQWVHHERLAYPLATLPLELFAAPERGRYYNKLWRNGVLWAGAAIPIGIGLLNGMHRVWPAVPEIRLAFDFGGSFTEHPWNQLPWYLSSSRLYMCVVGITFFIPSEIALSLWLFLMVNGLLRVLTANTGVDLDQTEPVRGMGIYFAYFAGLLWLARGHLRRVLEGAWLNSPREDGEFESYRVMVRNLLLCVGVAWLWLMIVGMQWWVALLILLIGAVMVTLMARIVAETGLFWVNVNWWGADFISSLLSPRLVTNGSFYWSQIVSRLFLADLRETLMPYATNVMRMAGRDSDLGHAERPRLLRWLFVALLLSAIVSSMSHHYLSYAYGRRSGRFDDFYATVTVPQNAPSRAHDFARDVSTISRPHAWGHFSFGAVMVATLMFGRVMFASWPFHPIGLLLMNAGPMQSVWFSILIGWGIKQLLLRYGGAPVFKRAKPFFIGLIVGEMLIAGVWMFIGLSTNGKVGFSLLPR